MHLDTSSQQRINQQQIEELQRAILDYKDEDLLEEE
jgi:hypothetical protein